jgi:hypothetical protein
MRILVFGPMPAGAKPATHIAAGVWCFVGREALFPDWDGSRGGTEGFFPLPPDPYADAAAVADAAASADAEVLRLCRAFASRYPGRDERFFLAALGPTLLTATHMAAERQQRLLDIIVLYGKQKLRVDILPEGDFSFRDSLDFMVRGVQNPVFNHYLYSRMLEHTAPPAWELRSVSPAPALPSADTATRDSLAARLRRILFRLPFPPLKGFGPAGALLLSCAVLLNKGRSPDASLNFSLYCSSPPRWHFPAEDLIMRCLPPALVRDAVSGGSPAAVRLPKDAEGRPHTSARTRLRGISPAYAQDDGYRLRLARLTERGARLFSVQHGANYGNLLSIGGLPFEYSLHAFFTWGWRTHTGHPVNARPMPHPALAALADTHREQYPSLILVGTEMSAFSYRLKSRPQSGALPAYRDAKVRFLRTVRTGLSTAPGAVVMYRPYFRAAGALDDGDRVFRLLPEIKPCTGDLTTHMTACRLLVLDHYGTTLHCALAAGTPTVAFWKRSDWGMDARSSAALDMLAQAGILHETPEDAAARVLAVWDNIARWWNGESVQNARRAWLDGYAWVDVPEEFPPEVRRRTSGGLCPPLPRSERTVPGHAHGGMSGSSDGTGTAADKGAGGLSFCRGPGAAPLGASLAYLRIFRVLRYWFRVLVKL